MPVATASARFVSGELAYTSPRDSAQVVCRQRTLYIPGVQRTSMNLDEHLPFSQTLFSWQRKTLVEAQAREALLEAVKLVAVHLAVGGGHG